MKTVFLPERTRNRLQEVWGTPIFGSEKEVLHKFKRIVNDRGFKKVITIGDRCSLSLPSDVKVFDKKINRKEIVSSLPFHFKLFNPAGTIQEKAWLVIEKAIKENKNVFVDGEEDLLVVPAVLLAEENSAVVYGFFEKGICLIEVTEEIKKDLKDLLKEFN